MTVKEAVTIKHAARLLHVDWEFLLGLLRSNPPGLDIQPIKSAGKTGGTVWLVRSEDVTRLREMLGMAP